MPDFSVITINYNDCEGLRETMKSVFNQSNTDFEYIIIDGGSTDGSINYIKSVSHKLSYWVSENDKGIYDAMNKGIQVASGNYLIFLNSGDSFVHSNILNEIKKAELKDSDIIYGDINIKNKRDCTDVLRYPSRLTLDFWKNSTINHQASAIKKALFSEMGNYDLSYTIAADYAFFLKCFFLGKKFKYLDQVLINYDLNGKSSRDENQYKLEMKRAWHNILPSYLRNLQAENKSYQLLMKHRLMVYAKKWNDSYMAFKNGLKKFR
jgi:glycosyltransferase involved in cell wall biosynthesis